MTRWDRGLALEDCHVGMYVVHRTDLGNVTGNAGRKAIVTQVGVSTAFGNDSVEIEWIDPARPMNTVIDGKINSFAEFLNERNAKEKRTVIGPGWLLELSPLEALCCPPAGVDRGVVDRG